MFLVCYAPYQVSQRHHSHWLGGEYMGGHTGVILAKLHLRLEGITSLNLQPVISFLGQLGQA